MLASKQGKTRGPASAAPRRGRPTALPHTHPRTHARAHATRNHPPRPPRRAPPLSPRSRVGRARTPRRRRPTSRPCGQGHSPAGSHRSVQDDEAASHLSSSPSSCVSSRWHEPAVSGMLISHSCFGTNALPIVTEPGQARDFLLPPLAGCTRWFAAASAALRLPENGHELGSGSTSKATSKRVIWHNLHLVLADEVFVVPAIAVFHTDAHRDPSHDGRVRERRP